MDDYSSLASNPVGIVRVDISCLAFENKTRADDPDIIKYLLSVFKHSSDGCEQDNPAHQLTAAIAMTDLDQMLENSLLTRDDLQRSLLGGGYPKLNTSNVMINCAKGFHRVKAAEEFLKERDPENCWWAVKLYALDGK
jgi:DNA-binding phage protein